jgi:hypothetical protein
MKIANFIADTVILLGALGFIAGIIFKVFFIRWLGLLPISFINFSQICFLLGIALYVRELILQKKE